MNLGFIGLGVMGGAMAKNLLAAGHALRVFDSAPGAAQALAEAGAAACGSAAEAAQGSRVVFLSLPNDAIVGKVLGEALKGLAPDSYVVDFSSVSPAAAARFADTAREKGVTYVDAPVSGGQKGAQNGTLTIMAGCTEGDFTALEPVLRTVGKKLFCMGAAGRGAAIKMVNNLLLGCNMAALAEALVLGRRYGLPAETMRDVIGVSSGRSYAFEAKLEPFILAGKYDGGFAVDLQRKDLGLAMDAAREAAVPLPVTAAAVQVYETARAAGLGRKDISSLVTVWEDLTGAKVTE